MASGATSAVSAATDAFAVILAGGGGTRLWPSSRRARPKQLLTLGGTETLLAAAVRRASAIFGHQRTLVVTAADQRAQCEAAVPDLPRGNLLCEPVPRNTAPAVGLAAAHVLRTVGRDAVLAILPADAHIGDEARFAAALRLASVQARKTIVTIGLRPTCPSTGFGYVQVGKPVRGLRGVNEVRRFVEKPNLGMAKRYVSSRKYLWNSGMFFLGAGRMYDEARSHLPKLGAFIDRAIGVAPGPALDAFAAREYPGVEAISIDYGIMEKAKGLRVVPAAFGWNDVGSWSALADIRSADARGNVAVGDVAIHDGRGSIVVADPGAPFVGVVGARDLVVVATRDGVLVIPRDRTQDVRLVVDDLRSKGRANLL